MQSLTRLTLCTIVVAAAGVCAPGCKRQTEPPPERVTMRVGVGLPRATADVGTGAVVNLLKADSWLWLKADGQVGERIFTDWSWDQPRTTLRLKLRPNVYFHDGTLLTADVAADTLRATLKSSSTSLSFSSIRSVHGEGSDTLVLELSERNAFILSDLGATLVTKPKKPDIGTGPFQVAARQGTDVTLTAFPNYYRGQSALAGIEVKGYPTQRNAWSALMRGDIDMLYEVSRDAADFVQAEKSVKSYSFQRPYYIPLIFNVRRPVFRDPRVRQAINEALDRAALVRDGMNGRGSVADGPIQPQHYAYAQQVTPFVFSPADARKLLDAAKYPLKTTPSSPVPVRFSFSCLAFGDDPRFERIEQLVQRQLADVGIEMRLEPLPVGELGARAAKGDFDAFLLELTGRSLSRVYEFWHSGESNRVQSGYQAADGVLDQIKAAGSDEEVKSAVAELQRIFHDDPPAAFLAWQEQTRAVSTKFDVGPDDKRDILTNLWQWRPATAK